MSLPISLSVFAPLPVHRLAHPRPVDLAPKPAGPAEPQANVAAPAAQPQAGRPLVSGATSALLGIDPSWIGGGASALMQAKSAGAYGLAAMPEAAALTPTQPKWAYEEVSGLGYFPGNTSADAASMKTFLREQIAAARQAAGEEKRLSEQAGVEARLAYDPNTEGMVALFPGDEGYGDIAGARAAYARMAGDLVKMGERYADYADLFRPLG